MTGAMLVSTHGLSLSHGDRGLAEIIILRMPCPWVDSSALHFSGVHFPENGKSRIGALKQSMHQFNELITGALLKLRRGGMGDNAHLTDEAPYKPRRTREVPKVEMLTRW